MKTGPPGREPRGAVVGRASNEDSPCLLARRRDRVLWRVRNTGPTAAPGRAPVSPRAFRTPL